MVAKMKWMPEGKSRDDLAQQCMRRDEFKEVRAESLVKLSDNEGDGFHNEENRCDFSRAMARLFICHPRPSQYHVTGVEQGWRDEAVEGSHGTVQAYACVCSETRIATPAHKP